MSKTRLILGTRKGLLIFEQRGDSFTPTRTAHLANNITYAMVDERSGRMWASIDHGHWGQKLSRSDDNGESWEEVPMPAYPDDAVLPGPQTDPKAEPAMVQAKMENVWVIAPGGTDQPDRLYLGTNPGGLFRSDDGGDNFELVRSLWDDPGRLTGWFGGGRDTPGIHSVVVDPRDSERVLIAVSCAGVFETTDDGAGWKVRNKGLKADFLPDPSSELGHDPHFLTLCPADPDVLWQQNHCGIFRSGDGGKQWSEISQDGGPAYFGFAIAADEKDPKTAWVVPGIKDETRVAVDGALCVCRTEDGGESWTAFRAGLPQTASYDITYRHALAIDGDRLAFGTTTGNLYLSSDRGESWTCLGNNFPPVYSVRFAS